MPLFCRKNVHSLQKKLCSHLIFLKFFVENSLLLCHILSKKVNSVKTKRYYGPKKLIRCPFFPSFANKSPSHAHILQKSVDSLKNTLLSCLYFFKKTVILSKTLISDIILVKFFMENALRQAHIRSKTVNLSKLDYIMVWAQKGLRMPFFSVFSRKKLLPCPYLV